MVVPSDGTTQFGILKFKGSGTVKGKVTDPVAGTGVGNVAVTLSAQHFFHDANTCGLVGGAAATTTTDINGDYRFSGVNVGAVGVTATSTFFPTSVGKQGNLTSDGGEVTLDLVLVNTTAGLLSGTVMLPDGTTPAGAGIELTAKGPLPDVTARTDDQGKYHFADNILPAGNYTVTVNDPVTGAVARDTVALSAGKDVVHDFRLKGRGTVRVSVVDGAGQPVSSASVKVTEGQYPNGTYEGLVDPSNQGVVTFDHVFEGPFSVVASDSLGRGGRASSAVPGPDATVDVQVSLTTTGTVTGVFYMPTLPTPTPIPYGSVQLSSNGRVIGTQTTPGTGDNVGGYSFDYVPAGQIQITASDPLTGRTGLAAGSLTQQGQVLPLDVTAQAIGSVHGTVTSNGSVAPFVQIEVYSGSFHVSTSADDQGVYVVEGVPAGHVVVNASLASNLLAGSNSGTLSQEGEPLQVDVALRDWGSVSGHVVQADGQTDAPACLVTMQIGGTGGGTFTVASDANGNFAFSQVPSGLATLSASVLGGIDQARGSIDVPAGDTAFPTLTLNGVGSIDGHATDASNNPIGGRVTVTGTGTFHWSYTLLLGTSGAFTLPQVLAGPFTASLTSTVGGFTLYGSEMGTVVPGEVFPLKVSLQPTGTVTGRVLRADGQTPAYGAAVSLRLDSNGVTVSVQAQADGRFTLTGVPLGTSTLRITDPVSAALGVVPGISLASDGEEKDLGDIVLNDQPLVLDAADPLDGATQVPVDKLLVLTFSNPLQSGSGLSIPGIGFSTALSVDGQTLTVTPSGGKWPDSRDVVYTVTTGVTDIYQRHPLQAQTGHFVTVDLTPPAVASTNPANGATQVGLSPVLTVTYKEDLSAGPVFTVTGPGGPFSGSATLPSPRDATYAPGALASDSLYHVSVNGAVDLSGNQQTAAYSYTFYTLDTLPPAMTLSAGGIALADGAWLKTATPALAAAFTDAISGPDMQAATMSIDGAAAAATIQGNSLVFTPTVPLAEGSHVLLATGKDKVGNVVSRSVTFAVDVTAPVAGAVTGVSDGDAVSGTVTLGASVSETGSGLARIDLLVDGTVKTTVPLATLSVGLNTASLSEGPHALAVRGVDVAGNTGAAGLAVTVVVDNNPISVTITTPSANGKVFGPSVAFAAAASEPVDRIDFMLGSTTLSATAAPYQATFDLTGVADGVQSRDGDGPWAREPGHGDANHRRRPHAAQSSGRQPDLGAGVGSRHGAGARPRRFRRRVRVRGDHEHCECRDRDGRCGRRWDLRRPNCRCRGRRPISRRQRHRGESQRAHRHHDRSEADGRDRPARRTGALAEGRRGRCSGRDGPRVRLAGPKRKQERRRPVDRSFASRVVGRLRRRLPGAAVRRSERFPVSQGTDHGWADGVPGSSEQQRDGEQGSSR